MKGKIGRIANYRNYFELDEVSPNMSSSCTGYVKRETESFLKISVEDDDLKAMEILGKIFIHGDNASSDIVQANHKGCTVRDYYFLNGSEMRRSAKETCRSGRRHVFSENLRQLFLAPPLDRKMYSAIDPDFGQDVRSWHLISKVNCSTMNHISSSATMRSEGVIHKFQSLVNAFIR